MGRHVSFSNLNCILCFAIVYIAMDSNYPIEYNYVSCVAFYKININANSISVSVKNCTHISYKGVRGPTTANSSESGEWSEW